MRLLTAIVLAGCSATPAPMPDAPAIERTCTAAFSGNFVETSTSTANCPTLETGVLSVSVASQTLATSVAVSVDLGTTPSSGDYTPETTTSWNARAQQVDNGSCLYSAGSDVVPHGDFSLALETADGPHGVLTLTLYVLAVPHSDCGDADTESAVLTF